MTEDEEFKQLCDMQDRDAEEVKTMTWATKELVIIAVIMLAVLAIGVL